MSGFNGWRAEVVWSERAARRSIVLGVLAAAVLALPSFTTAHDLPPPCPETWNPAHQPIKWQGVPGGWSTAPGTTNESTPQNPDGFFTVLSADDHDVALFGECGGIGPLRLQDAIIVLESGSHIKYTEANGKEPGFKEMAANNGQGGGNAEFISFHVWGPGDLYVCDAEEADPNNLTACTCCYVPPPPFTPSQAAATQGR